MPAFQENVVQQRYHLQEDGVAGSLGQRTMKILIKIF